MTSIIASRYRLRTSIAPCGVRRAAMAVNPRRSDIIMVHLFVDHAVALDEPGHREAKQHGHRQASHQSHRCDRIVGAVPIALLHPPDDLQVGATRRGPCDEPPHELLAWPGLDDRPDLRLRHELAVQRQREADRRGHPRSAPSRVAYSSLPTSTVGVLTLV